MKQLLQPVTKNTPAIELTIWAKEAVGVSVAVNKKECLIIITGKHEAHVNALKYSGVFSVLPGLPANFNISMK